MARSSDSEEAEYDENDYDCEDEFTDEEDYHQRQRRGQHLNGDSTYEDPRAAMMASPPSTTAQQQQYPWADVLFMIGFFPIAVNAATYALVVALNHLVDSVWSEEI
ncbi:hypothetical protein TKK_0011814 [Trichogramma kaykai]